MKTLTIKSLDDINSVAKDFIEAMGDNCVYAFYGEMGAGKTTFIKAICQAMGVTEPVTSPTFAIVNEYTASSEKTIYHFDFYRINKLEEAFDFGYEDYFYSGNLCLIEWPEKIESLLPDNCINVTITINEDNSRTVMINKN